MSSLGDAITRALYRAKQKNGGVVVSKQPEMSEEERLKREEELKAKQKLTSAEE